MVARWMAEFHCNLPADHRLRPSIPAITLCPRSHIQSSPSGTHLMRVCRGYPTSQQSYSSVISSGNRISHRPKPFHRDHPASRQYLAFSDISHLLWREKSSVVSKKNGSGAIWPNSLSGFCVPRHSVLTMMQPHFFMNIIPFKSAGIVIAVPCLPGCFSIQCGKGKYKQNKWLMKVVLRISYLAMSPADTPSLLAGVCPVRGKPGFAHGIPAGTCPVRGKPCFAHGILARALPCVESPDLRTASLSKPSRAWKARICAQHPCRSLARS